MATLANASQFLSVQIINHQCINAYILVCERSLRYRRLKLSYNFTNANRSLYLKNNYMDGSGSATI